MVITRVGRRARRLLKRENVALAAVAATTALATLLAPAATPAPRLEASDHIDSPSITQDRGSDLTDTWAFLDPNDNSKVVLMMSTQGFIVSGEHFGMAIFDHNIRYRFEIENNGDAEPDMFVDVLYSKGLGRTLTQTATIYLPDGASFTAPTTSSNQEYSPPPPVITTDAATGVTFYVGVADDPFFLDDTGANRTVASAIMNPGNPNKSLLGERGGRDTYAGFNTLITAVSVPADMLRGAAKGMMGGDLIGVNSVTQRRSTQTVMSSGEVVGSGDWVTVDRDGGPLVNNGLIPPPRKDEYNAATTVDDANGRFAADIIQSLKAFATDDEHIAMLAEAAVLKGDILRLDLSIPNTGPQGGTNPDGGFGKMGGRRLTDDVVDIVFTIINNGEPLGDNVNGNEVPFRSEFPFVADPAQPFPPGSGPDDRTRQ